MSDLLIVTVWVCPRTFEELNVCVAAGVVELELEQPASSKIPGMSIQTKIPPENDFFFSMLPPLAKKYWVNLAGILSNGSGDVKAITVG